MRQRFEYVYNNKIWGDSSGGGSDMAVLGSFVEWLNGFIKHENVETLLDFGCGMNGLGEHIVVPNYIGTDVVPSVVKYCKENYQLDIRLSNGLPIIKADVLLVKDVLMHWNVEEINKFLQHATKRYKHIVLVNCCNQTEDNPKLTNNHLSAMGLSYSFSPLRDYSPRLVMYLDKNKNDIKEVLLITNERQTSKSTAQDSGGKHRQYSI
jgi:hypothetical protein